GADRGPVGPQGNFGYSSRLRGAVMSDELKTKVQELIDTMINPAVAGHGGYVELIDVQDNRVYLQMGGGCQGCGAADVTLKAGIERLIKEELPEVVEVLDTTDHAAGANPYYTPGKAWSGRRPGGGRPFGGRCQAERDGATPLAPADHDVPHAGVRRRRHQARCRPGLRLRTPQHPRGERARKSNHPRLRRPRRRRGDRRALRRPPADRRGRRR